MNSSNTNKLCNSIYKKADKLTRGTPLTITGWFLLLTLLSVPLLLGFSYAGYKLNSQLIELQSKTNGMEHTTNYKQLHKHEKRLEHATKST